MIKTLHWSRIAYHEYKEAMRFLLYEWGEHIAIKFRYLTENKLNRISSNPEQFPFVSRKNKTRRCVVNKYIRIFF